MSFVTALLAGGVVGVRHALETDHLAAVATLAEDEGRDPRSGIVGVSWGIGHSVPIVVLGFAFLVLGIELPENATKLLEVGVGLVLVFLGARMLLDVSGVETHSHDSRLHSHLRVGSVRLGTTHHHVDGDSLLVGVLHGFAGSGALVVAMVAAAPALDTALAFLCAFSLLTILTMGVVSAVWSRTLDTGFTRHLKGIAAVLGIGVGVLLVVEQFTGIVVL